MKQFNKYIQNALPVCLSAVFPIAFVFAGNIDKVQYGDFIMLTGVSLGIGLVLFAFTAIVLRNSYKASIIVSIVLILFYSYGYIWEGLRWICVTLLNDRKAAFSFVRHRYLFPLFIAAIISMIVAVAFSKKEMKRFVNALTVFSTSLFLINCVIFFSKINTTDLKSKPSLTVPKIGLDKNNGFPKQLGYFPDIYYLTSDELAGFKTINKIYGFNPEIFKQYLINKGFYIVLNSRSNYHKTEFSLASSLNMDYAHINRAYITSNRVAKALKEIGYKEITWPDSKNHGWKLVTNDFANMVLNNSLLRAFLIDFHRNFILKEFSVIESVSKIPGPKFVHIHIQAPHVPFVFGPKGERIGYDDVENWTKKSIYLGQWRYVTTRIAQCIDSIVAHSVNKPIIIIQSDHGARSAVENVSFYSNVAFDIVNAIYFPDNDTSFMYDSITPVNTFRVLFNQYFKGGLKLLPDEQYSPLDKDFKQFENITSKMNQIPY